jgi:hypothetical protein
MNDSDRIRAASIVASRGGRNQQGEKLEGQKEQERARAPTENAASAEDWIPCIGMG